MATINLHERYEKHIDECFKSKSVLHGLLENKLSFENAQTVVVSSVAPTALNDYDPAAADGQRFGPAEEVSDHIQRLTMTQKKSINATMDGTYSVDQAIRKSNAYVKEQMNSVNTPAFDRYAIDKIAHNAGKVVGNSARVGNDTVVSRMNAARKYQTGRNVPTGGRAWLVSGDALNAIIESPSFQNLEKLGTKAIVEGHVGKIFGAPVIEVPEGRMDPNINFMLLHRKAAINPQKIKYLRTHINPPDIYGLLVQGLWYHDAFVLSKKADGIYVDVTTGNDAATVCAAPTVSADGKITLATGCTAKYTVDGSDPRYSASAISITASATTGVGTVGCTVRACQYKEGAYPSDVVSAVRTS